MLLAAACGGERPPPAQPLDPAAEAACETFAGVRGEVRRGELEGPPLYRALQDVYNAARDSDDDELRKSAERLLAAAINDDRRGVTAGVTELEQRCGLPFA